MELVNDFGFLGAAVAAGIVSWAVNSVLQARAARERIKQQKVKKQKRKQA